MIKNAMLERVSIDCERGFLVAWIYLNYGDGTCQGMGGWCLYNPHTSKEDYTGKFLMRMMEICGVTDLKSLVMKPIRVKISDMKKGVFGEDQFEGIGHFLEDIWFSEEFFKS